MSRSTAATVSNRLLFDYHPHEMLDRAFPMSRFYTEDPPHQLSLTLATGRTAAYASDGPGASFFAYIPTTHPLSQLRQTGSLDHVIPPSGAFPLVILVHGSDRDAESLRNRWADWAETRKVVLLAPLFPIHGEGAAGIDNYKQIAYTGDGSVMRYDVLLLKMIATLKYRWGYIADDGWIMCGFSGGGQFVQRFWYLHPSRLSAVSIGAPGNVTTLDPTDLWPRGVKGVHRLFGANIDICRLERTRVHLIVGEADNKARQHYAHTRLETLQKYSSMLSAAGIPHTLERIPGAAHEEEKLQYSVMAFVDRCLL